MTVQRALRNKPLELIEARSGYVQVSCTAYALAAWAADGQPSRKLLRNCTLLTYPHRDRTKKATQNASGTETYGLKHDPLCSVYGKLNLRYTNSLVHGVRYPRNCILILRDQNTGGSHAVARVDGPLYDTFDGRADEDTC